MLTKIGILGAGKIVEDAHLPVLENINEANVCWITDLDQKRLHLLSKTYRARTIPLDTFTQALGEVDVCLIAIPLGVRKPYIESCAEAGVAIYVEKPFARTRSEHEYYCSLFSDYGVGIGLQRRSYMTTQCVANIVRSEVFGKLNRIEFNFGQYSLKSGGADKHITKHELAGGGIIIESGIHGLDQILFSTAADSVVVSDAKAVVYDRTDYDSTVFSELDVNGRAVQVECNLTRLTNLTQGFRYYFEKAIVSFGLQPDSPLQVRSVEQSGDEEFILSAGSATTDAGARSVNQSFYLMWLSFIQGLNTKQSNIASARNSVLTTGWVEDIYRYIGCG